MSRKKWVDLTLTGRMEYWKAGTNKMWNDGVLEDWNNGRKTGIMGKE
jgi:hypothetical protein